jgi:hypothetical protein
MAGKGGKRAGAGRKPGASDKVLSAVKLIPPREKFDAEDPNLARCLSAAVEDRRSVGDRQPVRAPINISAYLRRSCTS